LATLEPGLALLDPAYRYMQGVRAHLFDMGAVLTPLQETCREAGSPLIIGHHFNRQEGKTREDRISGAGLLEWARLVITATAPPRREDDPDVIVTFELSGNSIDPLTFRMRRRVVKLDETPNPEISYSAEVIAEGFEAVASQYLTAAERVLAVLPALEDALTVREIGDLVAHDDTGKGGVKHDNIRRALNRDLDGQVAKIGELSSTRWWRS
jgi:hypothetical protein